MKLSNIQETVLKALAYRREEISRVAKAEIDAINAAIEQTINEYAHQAGLPDGKYQVIGTRDGMEIKEFVADCGNDEIAEKE